MNTSTPQLKSTRLLGQVQERIRYPRYIPSTEQNDLYWLRFFIRWSGQGSVFRHPRGIGPTGVEAFLTMLATERKVSASTLWLVGKGVGRILGHQDIYGSESTQCDRSAPAV